MIQKRMKKINIPAGFENIILLERKRVVGERAGRGNTDLIFGGDVGGCDHWLRHCDLGFDLPLDRLLIIIKWTFGDNGIL